MLQYYSKIVGRKVIGQHGPRAIAVVTSLILDYEKGVILALETNKKAQIISLIDILRWDEKIVVNDDSALIDKDEIVRLNQIKPFPLINHPVKARDGHFVGYVQDFTFDSNTGSLMRLYVAKKKFGVRFDRRIISVNDIIEIKKKAVIVKNNIIQEKIKAKEVLLAWRKGLTPRTCSFQKVYKKDPLKKEAFL